MACIRVFYQESSKVEHCHNFVLELVKGKEHKSAMYQTLAIHHLPWTLLISDTRTHK